MSEEHQYFGICTQRTSRHFMQRLNFLDHCKASQRSAKPERWTTQEKDKSDQANLATLLLRVAIPCLLGRFRAGLGCAGGEVKGGAATSGGGMGEPGRTSSGGRIDGVKAALSFCRVSHDIHVSNSGLKYQKAVGRLRSGRSTIGQRRQSCFSVKCLASDFSTP